MHNTQKFLPSDTLKMLIDVIMGKKSIICLKCVKVKRHITVVDIDNVTGCCTCVHCIVPLYYFTLG